MPLELVPLCTFDIVLKPPIVLGPTPLGARLVIELESVEVTGERLRGRMRGAAGADWVVIAPDSAVGTPDVRFCIETDDGAVVFVHYNGRLDNSQFPPVVYTAPLFDTGDERYAWLSKIQAVAKGSLSEDMRQLTYEVCEVR